MNDLEGVSVLVAPSYMEGMMDSPAAFVSTVLTLLQYSSHFVNFFFRRLG